MVSNLSYTISPSHTSTHVHTDRSNIPYLGAVKTLGKFRPGSMNNSDVRQVHLEFKQWKIRFKIISNSVLKKIISEVNSGLLNSFVKILSYN